MLRASRGPALVEPFAAPIIPVSGIAAVTELAEGQVCVTYYLAVPFFHVDGSSIEHQVAAKLLYTQQGFVTTVRKFPEQAAAVLPHDIMAGRAGCH